MPVKCTITNIFHEVLTGHVTSCVLIICDTAATALCRICLYSAIMKSSVLQKVLDWYVKYYFSLWLFTFGVCHLRCSQLGVPNYSGRIIHTRVKCVATVALVCTGRKHFLEDSVLYYRCCVENSFWNTFLPLSKVSLSPRLYFTSSSFIPWTLLLAALIYPYYSEVALGSNVASIH